MHICTYMHVCINLSIYLLTYLLIALSQRGSGANWWPSGSYANVPTSCPGSQCQGLGLKQKAVARFSAVILYSMYICIYGDMCVYKYIHIYIYTYTLYKTQEIDRSLAR